MTHRGSKSRPRQSKGFEYVWRLHTEIGGEEAVVAPAAPAGPGIPSRNPRPFCATAHLNRPGHVPGAVQAANRKAAYPSSAPIPEPTSTSLKKCIPTTTRDNATFAASTSSTGIISG